MLGHAQGDKDLIYTLMNTASPYRKQLSVVAAVALLLSSCGYSLNNLSGKYQDGEETIGSEFLEDNNAVIKTESLDGIGGQYEILKGESGESLKFIGGPLDSGVMGVEKKGDTITLARQGYPLELTKVDQFSIQSLAHKAQQSEAKTYIGSLNRSQQAFFLEEGKFSSELDALGLGISAETDNYSYSILPADSDTKGVVTFAQPKDATLNAYIGITNFDGSTTQAVLCEVADQSADVDSLAREAKDTLTKSRSSSQRCPQGAQEI